MANPSDQHSGPDPHLPPPELNPLLNPILERNLGRWAQVYFTSPPEQRDQAVVDLLRELKIEDARQHPPQPPDSGDKLPATPAPENEPSSENSLDWLRSKNLSLAYESDGSAPKWIWRVLAPIVAVAVVGFVYSQWRTRLTFGQHPVSAVAAQSSAGQQEADLPIEGMSDAAPGAASAAPRQTQVPNAATAAETQKPTPLSPSTSADASADSKAQGAGGVELSHAQEYLDGTNVPRDSAIAAEWLWQAVRKGNTTAELRLADLYLRGEGVAKNCEQARLLLVAASRRGRFEAADKLRNLESAGCS